MVNDSKSFFVIFVTKNLHSLDCTFFHGNSHSEVNLSQKNRQLYIIYIIACFSVKGKVGQDAHLKENFPYLCYNTLNHKRKELKAKIY